MDHGTGRPFHRSSRKFLAGLVGQLIDSAEANFRLDIPDQRGTTPRERWSDAERIGLVKPEEWRPDPIPYQLMYVWNWFLDLHQARRFGPKGHPLSIDYQDMLHWSILTDRKLSTFDIKLIRQLDQRFFYVLNNPNGVAPSRYLDAKQVDDDVAGFLRAMRSMKAPGVAELPKPSKVAALDFKSDSK